MINDFPNLSTYTSQALFADDANIWRSGTNLRQITFHIQEDITKIEQWSLNWGFSINSDKSTAVLFTNKKTELPINITINNQKVKIEEKLKFLGIYFDKKLTWKPQIDEMINKTKQTLNLMKCFQGIAWGISNKTLLTLYKTLIRSR